MSQMKKQGPYGGVGGIPWTDVDTFRKYGQLAAIEIRTGDAIDAIRARYSTI